MRVGLNYPGPDGKERRAEVDAIVSDLPAEAIAGLIEQGDIEPADVAPAKE